MADGILVEVPLRKPREAIVVTLGRRQQNMTTLVTEPLPFADWTYRVIYTDTGVPVPGSSVEIAPEPWAIALAAANKETRADWTYLRIAVKGNDDLADRLNASQVHLTVMMDMVADPGIQYVMAEIDAPVQA
jgi:hypothetical protein